MALYVIFAKWTDQGVRKFWDTVDRVQEVGKYASEYGVEMLDTLWTPGGPHDMISIAEAHDNKSFAAFVLTLESLGSVRITWAPAYRADEMREVVTKSQ